MDQEHKEERHEMISDKEVEQAEGAGFGSSVVGPVKYGHQCKSCNKLFLNLSAFIKECPNCGGELKSTLIIAPDPPPFY